MEIPVKSGGPGETSTSVWPTIQSQSVHCQEDEVLLGLCPNLGQAAPGEGGHRYGIDSEVQLDLHVGPGRKVAEGISQKHFLDWPVCDYHVILLKSEEHPLEMCRGHYEILQADHFQQFVVHLNDECPPVQVHMEFLTAIYNGQELPLNVGIAGLCL